MVSRVNTNGGSIRNSNAQSDLQSDYLAMSLACSALGEEELQELRADGPTKKLKLNLNKAGTNLPSVGECLLFVRGKDSKFQALGFNRVELDQRTLQDLTASCMKEEDEIGI